MAIHDTLTLPLDAASAESLSRSGLEYRRVDATGDAFVPFLRAVSRGFLDADPSADEIESARASLRSRRLTGVFDAAGEDTEVPVATVDSWASELTTSPGRTLPLWSISAVTVAPTHRRRGIARAMLTGELRTAAAAGYPVAGLTVTEATIYGRWGFSPAVWAAGVEIDTARARWVGPVAPGRLDFVERETLPARLSAVHERIRVQRPGAVPGWEGRWRGIAGLTPAEKNGPKVRGVVYRDPEGVERGVLVYTLHEPDGPGFGPQELRVRALFADGDDATAALWRFAVEHDLVGRVRADLQPVAPSVQWMLADRRAVTTTPTDHHWLRVLDVPAALAGRLYSAPLAVTLRVDDPLGFADGTWDLRVDESGQPTAGRATAGAADVDLSVGALGSLLLGGVRASELASGGLVSGEASVLRDLDRAFAPASPPLLDIWY